MKTDNKHFKFINSETGNAIYYHSVDKKLTDEETKAQLNKIRARAAVQNVMPASIIYWEEIRDYN